jgi:hypothetical protein
MLRTHHTDEAESYGGAPMCRTGIKTGGRQRERERERGDRTFSDNSQQKTLTDCQSVSRHTHKNNDVPTLATRNAPAGEGLSLFIAT